MSQMGMQMPGAARGRAPSLNIYTGLMAVAVVCLLAAVVQTLRAGMTIGPEGSLMGALSVHEGNKPVNLGK
ncbi:MAG: hypothetical protein IBJ11_04075 [Phycisphaerales bacterium]|nr:hypothetical protein [Phycisphaerales bacterium]